MEDWEEPTFKYVGDEYHGHQFDDEAQAGVEGIQGIQEPKFYENGTIIRTKELGRSSSTEIDVSRNPRVTIEQRADYRPILEYWDTSSAVIQLNVRERYRIGGSEPLLNNDSPLTLFYGPYLDMGYNWYYYLTGDLTPLTTGKPNDESPQTILDKDGRPIGVKAGVSIVVNDEAPGGAWETLLSNNIIVPEDPGYLENVAVQIANKNIHLAVGDAILIGGEVCIVTVAGYGNCVVALVYYTHVAGSTVTGQIASLNTGDINV